MKLIKATLLIFFGIHFTNAFAQKQFNNGVSISIGSEYVANEPEYFFPYYAVFTQKPIYGAQLGYERRIGRFFSIHAGGAFFYGLDNEEIWVREPDGNAYPSDLKNEYARMFVQLGTSVWVVQGKKYSFTPGIALQYGRTINYNYSIKELNVKWLAQPNHQYANVSVQFTNRFLLKRLRSERKGNYGEWQLLVTPYFLANVYKNLDWQADPIFKQPDTETLLGGGLSVGLGFQF